MLSKNFVESEANPSVEDPNKEALTKRKKSSFDSNFSALCHELNVVLAMPKEFLDLVLFQALAKSAAQTLKTNLIERNNVTDNNEGSSGNENRRNYSSYKAFKIYGRELKAAQCSKVGDASFFAVERAWQKPNYDFLASKYTQRKMLPLSFGGHALKFTRM